MIEMPPKYLIEMLCDWVGAGKAYNKGKWTIDIFKAWYQHDKSNMVLHTLTRSYIELLMGCVKTEEELYRCWFNIKRIKGDKTILKCQGGDYQPRIKLLK